MGTPLLIASLIFFHAKSIQFSHELSMTIKNAFGLLLMGMAILLVGRLIQPMWENSLWAALIILTAIYMNSIRETLKGVIAKLWSMLSIMTLVCGISLFVFSIINYSNLFMQIPLNQMNQSSYFSGSVVFNVEFVTNEKELEDVLALGKTLKKPLLISFYAQWCRTCLKIDSNVFTDRKVNLLMRKFILLRIDLSNSNSDVMSITKKYHVIAPPTIIFFDREGKLINTRVEGDISAEDFANILRAILNQ